MEFNMVVLTRELMEKHLSQLVAMDQNTHGEDWEERHFRFEANGKWEFSRLLVDQLGRPAGFAIASIKPAGIHLHRLVIKRDLRGKGLGARLVRELGVSARNRAVNQITLKVSYRNSRATAFYRRLGFMESERTAKSLLMKCDVSPLCECRPASQTTQHDRG